MTTATIEQRLSEPEGKQLEFKRDLSSPKPLMKTLVAFANTAGGQLIIGVDDDGTVLGVDDPLDMEERLTSMIADAIHPRLLPNIELVSVGEHTLVCIEVFLSSARPHFFKALGEENGVLVRLGSSNRQAGLALIQEMQRQASGTTFDVQAMPELSRDDLDQNAIQQAFRSEQLLDDNKLRTLRLLVSYQGRLVPSVGGILLFGRERQWHFEDAWIQCGRFRGNDKVEIFDQTDIHAPLPQAVDDIELFLKKHAFKQAEFGAMRRRDVWSIPLTILREAIINALVHSDYSQRGSPIRIAFYDDRIEIESPGLLMPGMTIEDMKRGVSMIRNPVIARVFRELGLIEQWGSGVKRIFSEAQVQGLPEPHIEEIANRVRLSIRLATPVSIQQSASVTQAESVQSESRLESRLESALAARVLLILQQEPLGKAAMARELGHKGVSGELNKQVGNLRQQQLIEMTLPEKPNSRLQQYRLTPQGQRFLQDTFKDLT
ncbi:MAG TPA: AAA family ATPase [Halomonas campaniensis]|nr:AAA family ATPase [Halomonas campaniensis]